MKKIFQSKIKNKILKRNIYLLWPDGRLSPDAGHPDLTDSLALFAPSIQKLLLLWLVATAHPARDPTAAQTTTAQS